MRISKLLFAFLILATLTISCKSDDNSEVTTFDIFTVQLDGTTVIMSGEIQNRTLEDFDNMLERHPDIDLINMQDVPGSDDDEINFQVGIKLRQNGISTHILDNSEIASGGVDLFLAGVKRTGGDNVKIGVHSWSDGDGNQATDYPVDSDEHRPNIKYYEDLGYSDQWANDFYFFTINAAPAADIHWMTESEIDQFEVFN